MDAVIEISYTCKILIFIEMNKFFFLSLFLFFTPLSTYGQTSTSDKLEADLQKTQESAQKYIKLLNNYTIENYWKRGRVRMNNLQIDTDNKKIHLYLNKFLAEAPLRPEMISQLKRSFLSMIPAAFKKYELSIYADSIDLVDYIPNLYRKAKTEADLMRLPQNKNLRPFRRNLVEMPRPFEITNGLVNSNIALWASHGWYFESTLHRWEWQRARLFTTVEDLLPASFVIPYLMPMLYNSGAFVLTPRERDMQLNEIIMDNDSFTNFMRYPSFLKKSENNTGYAWQAILKADENPFRNGSYLSGTAHGPDSIQWIADIPENGDYQIYISYGFTENASKLRYRVYYAGGHQDYLVDQSIGYGTWIPLGKHHFRKGHPDHDRRLVLYFEKGQTGSIDAIRFGGGMGNIERNGIAGRKPRFMEAPRYYLQYCGFPDSLTWKPNGENMDYTDNFRSQGDWLNYLIGKPFGPARDSSAGLGIPIDLSFSFHTDAGVLRGDSVMGTLGIYSTTKDSGFFADGQSRFVSRDLTDLIQSQIVEDIRSRYNKNWIRRGLWNSDYSEAYKPNVPAMLLELLSHQNPNEMKLALDPNFRFDVSRAIYKGMLRFVSYQNGYDYVVHPLPVTHFKSELMPAGSVKLSWTPVADLLEPTAKAEKYMVYTRIGNSGFDTGQLVDTSELIVENIEKNKIYSFKVTAVNQGGESFPSEILSVGFSDTDNKPVLIVNAFDRLEAPQYIETSSFSGFMRQLDQGVPYLYDFHTTGDQYDFDPQSPWLDDDAPGFGASYANEENLIYPGNTFDFPFIHGEAFLNNGYSFISMSDEAFKNQALNVKDFLLVDFIFGEEKTKRGNHDKTNAPYKVYTSQLIKMLEILAENKIPVFISGSYIGTEIGQDPGTEKKIGDLLGFKFRTNHAVKNGTFYLTEKPVISANDFDFVTRYDKYIYPAESPDAIEPYNEKSNVLFRYSENNTSAGVSGNGLLKTVALGFPFECISNSAQRDQIISLVIDKLVKK